MTLLCNEICEGIQLKTKKKIRQPPFERKFSLSQLLQRERRVPIHMIDKYFSTLLTVCNYISVLCLEYPQL